MSMKQFIPHPVPLFSQKEFETLKWEASYQHYELEKLRVLNPERYRLIYPSVMRMRLQRRNDLVHE